jgi:hypothetical protein
MTTTDGFPVDSAIWEMRRGEEEKGRRGWWEKGGGEGGEGRCDGERCEGKQGAGSPGQCHVDDVRYMMDTGVDRLTCDI